MDEFFCISSITVYTVLRQHIFASLLQVSYTSVSHMLEKIGINK